MSVKVFLIHGLSGSSDKTWEKFPDLLNEDPEIDVEVISLEYSSPHWLWEFYKRAPTILNIANGLLTDIESKCNLGEEEVIIVAHSLGGIVLKKMLLIMKARKIGHKISKLCFFDVPHDGSGYANIGKYVSFRNRHLKQLSRDSGELDDLNDQWMMSGLSDLYEILSVISADDDVVSSSSSKSIFRGHPVKTINNVNHKTIVKPTGYDSPSYLVLKSFIIKNKTVFSCKNDICREFNDWLSIDRRDHGFDFVSDDVRQGHLLSLVESIRNDQSVIRLTGASGIGKTRTLLQAINDVDGVNEDNTLIFNAEDGHSLIKRSVRCAVDNNVLGLIIVENCGVDLHNSIAAEVSKKDCQVRVVTIGYSDASVELSLEIHLSPLSDEAITDLLTPILIDLDAGDIERVSKFVQGYPLIAVLMAQQYRQNGKLLGSIDDRSIVRKLIAGDSRVGNEEKSVLTACSLFDVFGLEYEAAGKEAEFIAEDIAESTLDVFSNVVEIFESRQIINRAGRYARVIPKPLALSLAEDWWSRSTYEMQVKLIDSLPDSLIESFCTQVSYLDNQPNVKKLSDRLFGGNTPFVQAEVLFTEKGSKLFRAFVEVNPQVTSRILYHVMSDMNLLQLRVLQGKVRRNFVWALEKLCFHQDLFQQSAWCLLLLAAAENESYSNNATGTFSHLYAINGSGTEAPPEDRFSLLTKAISLGRSEVDMVVLEALGTAINFFGGMRVIGAEYQGTKVSMQEWRPAIWKEIHDYWQSAFDLMLVIMDRGGEQKEKVLQNIGHSIRGFVSCGRIEMIDNAVREIVSRYGKNWPDAVESINNSFEFEGDSLNDESRAALNSWLDLLNPDGESLSEKIQILVSAPPRHHRKEDGHYVDVSAVKAEELAQELSSDLSVIYGEIDNLLTGEQKQAYVFGRKLVLDAVNYAELVDNALERLSSLESPNIDFVRGLFRGICERSSEDWQKYVGVIAKEDGLSVYYPDFITTGQIDSSHLDVLLRLVSDGVVDVFRVGRLAYGSVTDSLSPSELANFCIQFSGINQDAAWIALDLIFMYGHGNENAYDGIEGAVKSLIFKVSLSRRSRSSHSDVYHWKELAEKMLIARDEQFVVALGEQLVADCDHDYEHGDIWNYIKPFLLEVMPEYQNVLWPIFGEAIVAAVGSKRFYWLQQLLDRENSASEKMPSVLSKVDTNTIVEWCRENPEIGPYFVASAVDMIKVVDGVKQPTELFIALLEHFGDIDEVSNALQSNMRTRGWTGSLVPILESDKKAFESISDHTSRYVRKWVKEYIASVEQEIEYESSRDAEHELGIY